jgi:predicted Zn-dependent protease with MMP-like domain
MDFETLNSWASEELEALLKVLPQDIQEAAGKVSISFEEKPGQGFSDDQLDGDELGLFEGPSAMDEAEAGELPRIRLFLNNLWEWTDESLAKEKARIEKVLQQAFTVLKADGK